MKKILIVEDHLEVRENLQELLELMGYEVSIAPDGEKGIRQAIEAKPDLILCDIMMPGISGYDVLTELSQRTETASIPFIFLSAKTDKSDIRRGMSLGADDYLTKPYEEEELLKVIELRLKKHETLQNIFDYTVQGLERFLSRARLEKNLENISQHCGIQSFESGTFIYQQGKTPERLYFVASGFVETFATSPQGDRQTTGSFQAGDFFGYSALIQGTPYSNSAQVQEEAEISSISREDFFSLLLNNRSFSSRFIKMLARHMREKESQLLKSLYSTARKRVLQTIIQLKPQTSTIESWKIPVQRIAEESKMASSNLNMVLYRLDHENLIDLKSDYVQLIDHKLDPSSLFGSAS